MHGVCSEFHYFQTGNDALLQECIQNNETTVLLSPMESKWLLVGDVADSRTVYC